MKTSVSATLVGLAVLAGCSEATPTGTVPVFDVDAAMGVVANGGSNSGARLSGDEEVPAIPTLAHGAATFQLSDDGTELSYRLIVANISNVVQSHIHLGPTGQNGPVVAFLYGPVAAGGGLINGPIAEGTLTSADLVGPLVGLSVADLMSHVLVGNAYVNVHTSDGVPPSNTGPGDFPGGEVPGQIR